MYGSQRNEWDVVATCFFIDTANNVGWLFFLPNVLMLSLPNVPVGVAVALFDGCSVIALG